MDEWLRFESLMQNQGITERRLSKLKQMFATCRRGLGKQLTQATREDVEGFVTRLHNNKFRTSRGKQYSGSSKADIKKFLKQFFKVMLGEGEYYPKQVAWIRCRISKDELPKEKPILSYEEICKMAQGFEKIQYRAMALVLFDSGFRVSELMSVKKKNLVWEDFQEGEKCFWISCNESKTIPRKVPIPLFTEELQMFINSSYFKILGEDDYIWPVSYTAINVYIARAAQRALGRKGITPHALRHSSATYYSAQYDGNLNLIAQRYGWSFNSDEVKTYIRRSGAYQKAGVKRVYENQTIALRKQVERREEENKTMREELQALKQTIQELAGRVDGHDPKPSKGEYRLVLKR